jgi:uncharacterized protein (TIGR00251 family)
MGQRNFHLHDGKKGAALAVRVTPRSSRNEIVEVLSDGTVKVHITAPPVDGKANEVLIKFLAQVLDIPPSRIDVVAGATGRDKLISVIDMDVETLHKKIVEQLS